MSHQALLTEENPIPIPKHLQFRRSWRWKHPIEEFFKIHTEGKHSLNVCCGQSKIGTCRVDVDPNSTATHLADIRALPFKDNTFDVTISDPPWKLGFFQRFRPFYECVRVTKLGGLIIYNATWVPFSNQCVEIERYSRCDMQFRLASVISVFKKVLE